MGEVYECIECGEWYRNEKDVYQEDNGDCICVSCWEDNVVELTGRITNENHNGEEVLQRTGQCRQ